MLDRLSLVLLNIINDECSDSGYKVFSIDDVMQSFPTRFKVEEEGVRESLNNLSAREYVIVKYEDEKEFCAIPTAKGRLVFENRIEQEIERAQTAKKYFVYSALGAFLGGIFAFVIATVLTFALRGAI